MKVDAYTQGVLTVIAVALVTIAIQNAIQPAVAKGGVQRVTICNDLGQRCHGLPIIERLEPVTYRPYQAVVVTGNVGTYAGERPR